MKLKQSLSIFNNKQMQGEIILITGPMYSGKTTTLISKLERFKRTGKKILVIKYINDLRYTNDNKLISHSKMEFCTECIYSQSLKDIDISAYDIIGIDEGQFFNDIVIVNEWANMDKKIIISALNGTYKQTNFNNFEKLYPYIDDIITLKAICSVCNENDASFTYKKNKDININKSADIIDIGGDDKYIAICRKCITINDKINN